MLRNKSNWGMYPDCKKSLNIRHETKYYKIMSAKILLVWKYLIVNLRARGTSKSVSLLRLNAITIVAQLLSQYVCVCMCVMIKIHIIKTIIIKQQILSL